MPNDDLQRWLADIDCKPDTLRMYAGIFETARRHTPEGPLVKASDISLTAAKCFRLAAELKDLQAILIDTDPNVNKLVDTTGPSVNEFIDAKYGER